MTLLAPKDVAARLHLSVSRIIQLDREGRLPAFRDRSGRRFYDADLVERFAVAREQRRAAAMPTSGTAHSASAISSEPSGDNLSTAG